MRLTDAIRRPSVQEQREVEAYYRRLGKRLNLAVGGKPERFALVYKAIAHALLFRAQFHAIPTDELVAFLRSLIPLYAPGGGKLQMGPELRERLETTVGMPQWPSPADRKAINKFLTIIYKGTDRCPVPLQIRIFWHMLMKNAEVIGLTHEAVLKRLEVLDRFNRTEPIAHRYIPSEPPTWARDLLAKTGK